MNRGDFIKACSGTCLGLVGISLLVQSCVPYSVLASNSGNRLSIEKKEFAIEKNGKNKYRKFVLLTQDDSTFPIVVYRNAEDQYKAFLLRCTHQGNELSVHGEIITCSAHGSEFDKDGNVIEGPAEENLKSFPVTFDADNIYIQLS